MEIWILARLYNGACLDDKELLRKLCDASFDMIKETSDYDSALENLQNAKYIENVTKTIEAFEKIDTPFALTPKLQQVNKKISGFEITRAGLIAYRKEIIFPIQKTKPYFSKLDKKLTEPTHKELLQKLINSSDMPTAIINACIDNAPLIMEILQKCFQLLSNHGISF